MTRALVTGGAGFIGANLVARLIDNGGEVVVLDDLSRRQANVNVAWLADRYGPDAFVLARADLRDRSAVDAAMSGCGQVFHLAGQVAVTTSIAEPVADFEANALGTLNVLEAARAATTDPVVVYASTNKVYGSLDSETVETATRHKLAGLPHGVPESHPIDLQTPYGCSKGAADLYALDYHRTFGLRTVVFRQSCVYGPRQLGSEDQGWLAWLLSAAMTGTPITIYGDGKQVRDILYIDDLLDAFAAAVSNIDTVAGEVFNIGGGPDNTISIWSEFGPLVEELLGHPVPVSHQPARSGDQRVYVSDIRKAEAALSWAPRVGPVDGIGRLADWLGTQSLDLTR